MQGLLISFEGIDGSGKSLMIKLLAQQLRQKGYDLLVTREPGGSEMGRGLRKLILNSPMGAVDERSEALLFAADRALHVAQVIRPALSAGRLVLCDRYVDSSYAYQSGGRSVSLDEVRRINEFATDGLLPHRTFLLDLPAEVALARLHGQRDRMEQEQRDFFCRTAAAYRQLAAAEPQRFVVIDATCRIEQELAAILQQVQPLLDGSARS